MKLHFSSVLATLALLPSLVLTQEHRQLDGHETIYEVGNVRTESMHLLTMEESQEIGLSGTGPFVLISELLYQGIKAMDLANGNVTQLVPSQLTFARSGLGIQYANGMILVAGGGPRSGVKAAIYAFDGTTGELMASCTASDGFFLNDLVVRDDRVYVTDGYVNKLFYTSLADLGSQPECILDAYETSADLFVGDAATEVLRTNGRLKSTV